MKNLSVKNKVAIITIITIILGLIIGIFAYSKLNNNETQTVNASSHKLATEEEIIPEVKEEVVLVSQDTAVDESLKDLVKFEDKVVTVPKSTVAAVNSSEDAERNKKKGGAAVSQEQTQSMFENVGTKSFGIDVSAHQGKIDWNAVKASGVDFAIIRCGFRGQTAGSIYEDAYFKRNVSAATAAGIKVGIYFYSTAVNENEALEEAAWVVKKISTYRITYPVVYDFEDFGAYRCKNVDGAQATSNALTFLNFVKSNGYEPMMYANKSDITTRLSRGSFPCKFWLAHYTSQTDYTGNINMWQYTSKGSVPGITGNVDMNIAYFSYGATAEAKHAHNFNEVVKKSEKAATCTNDGSKTMRCSCGETEVQTIPKTGHKFSDWKTVKKATYEEQGLKERICSICKEKEEESIKKLEKNSNTTNTSSNVNNTSTNTNTNTSKNETVDNTAKNEVENIVPPSHTHEWIEDESQKQNATCKEDGYKILKCSCGESKKETISKNENHNYENGKCSVCEKIDETYSPENIVNEISE